MNKLVSVIIPTYKRSEFLLRTIESVLNQTYKNIEIIVVDDNGLGTEFQKKTQEKLQPLIDAGNITYIPHEVNKNGAAARNTGFRNSKGEYINFLDDDDELMPDKIERQVIRIDNSLDIVGATYCNKLSIRQRGVTGKKITSLSDLGEEGNILESYLLDKNEFGTSQILFKREALEYLDGFDETYFRHQDVELMTRFFEKYEIVFTSGEPLVKFDMSKDRSNVPSPNRDIEIKTKYLSEFDAFLRSRNLKEIVFHHFWYKCMQNALRARNYKVAQYAYKKSSENGCFTLREKKVLLKRFLVGMLSIVSDK